jgi:hypothetical protein
MTQYSYDTIVLQISEARMVRKRELGAGRKPSGDFSRLTEVFTVRMPRSMRAQLNAAARKNGRVVGQELLSRVQRTFDREEANQRNPALRALLFLFGELANKFFRNPNLHKDHSRRLVNLSRDPNWHKDPFTFRAFKLAIVKLMDALEPKGETRPPPEPFPGAGIYKTPSSAAKHAADLVLFELHNAEPLEGYADMLREAPWFRGGSREVVPAPEEALAFARRLEDVYERNYYAMSNVRRDLAIDKKEDEK